MDKDFLIQLTSELYRITLLFPKKDPLRFKVRDVGTDILAQMAKFSSSQTNPGVSRKWRKELSFRLENNLAVLDGYFNVAKAQNWVSPEDIINIKNEYHKIKDGLKAFVTPIEALGVEPREMPREMVSKTFLKKRQAEILEVLENRGRAQVQDFKREFPHVSKRTLRRDLKDLLEQGVIKRTGKRNETFYEIK